MRVAFLGLGRMGVAMASHVVSAGHELVVWNRTPGKAGDLVAAGATEAPSARAAAEGADAVVLMLFGPDSVREVLPEVLRPGLLVVDSTTIGPEAAREFAKLSADAGARYVDAPVAGSIQPATDGTLGVLAAGLGETLRLGTELGLDRTLVLDVLSAGAYGWTLNQKRSMLESSDYSGTQFSVDLLAKDLELAVNAARDAELEVTRAVLDAARKTIDAGHSGEDYAAIIGHLADEGEADSH